MKSIKRVFDYYEGIHQQLFWNSIDNNKVINTCPMNGKSINYDDLSDIPFPCNGCGCLNLAEIRVRSGCNTLGTLNYCFDGEPNESCPGNCEYEVIGICKRFCEIEQGKITLMKWM